MDYEDYRDEDGSLTPEGRAQLVAWSMEHELTDAPEPDEDDLAFARETLGPNATDAEIYELAAKRALIAVREG